MKTSNPATRNRRIITFAGLYAASIILLFFIFSAFGFHFSARGDAGTIEQGGLQPGMNQELYRTDSALHAGLYQLQQLDSSYLFIGDDTAAAELKKYTVERIGTTEQALEKLLDSAGSSAGSMPDPDRQAFVNMLQTFRLALNERQLLRGKDKTAAKSLTVTGEAAGLLLRNELLEKENELVRLRAALKDLQQGSFVLQRSAGASEAAKGQTEVLQTAFANVQKDYDALKETYNRLKTENNAMASQLVEYKKMVPARQENLPAPVDKRAAVLEQKLADIQADLSFARIDCNLDRADVQQIISNARQRKELLSESLNLLRTLAASEDPQVQKKAKDKIGRLNRIANALHD